MMRIKTALAWSTGELLHAVRTSRRARAALAAVVLLLAAGGVGGYLWWKSTALPDGAALAVGERVVTVDELDARMQSLRALYGVEAPKDDQKRMDGFRRDSAKAFAVAIVLQDKARELGVDITDATARKTLDGYVADQFGRGASAHDEFVKALGNVGASEREVLDEIKQQLAVSKLFDQVTRGVTVGEQELRAAFPRYRERLGEPEKRHLFNIVVTSKGKAEQLLEELSGGSEFAQLAREYSIDGSTRAEGGDLGVVARAQLEQDYAKAAFAAAKGDAYGPVRNEHGWNIGMVAKVDPGAAPEFADVQNELRQLVKYDKQLERWQQWLAAAIEEKDVRYADAYQPDDPHAVPTDAQPKPRGGR